MTKQYLHDHYSEMEGCLWPEGDEIMDLLAHQRSVKDSIESSLCKGCEVDNERLIELVELNTSIKEYYSYKA